MQQLLGIFAEFERGLLIDRITKGFERKAARGEWLGGPGPYGYTLDSATKTLIADPEEAATVGAIFAKYVEERYVATALAHWLNDTGQRSRHGKLWSNGGAYVGAGAHGRNSFYRYYVCRTRQAKGARACTSQRVPADDLEDAIAAALIATYDELIDRIDISPDKHAQPYFWVPDVQQPGPSLARACGTPASPVSGTPVRMGPHQVELRGLEPLTSCLQSRRSSS